MANEQSGIKFFVILTICCLSAKVTFAETSDDDEGSSPLLDVMQQLLQDSSKEKGGSGVEAIGGMLQMFMQSGGGKQLGDMLTAGGSRKFKSNTMNIISGLSSLWASQKGRESNNEGEDNGGGGASILGSMVDIIAAMNQNDGEDNSIDSEDREPPKKKKKSPETNIDAGAALGMLGNLLSSMSAGGSGKDGGGGAGLETMLSFLPVLFSSMGGKHHPHSSSSVPHHTHEPFLPPFFENLHEYWDHFRSSEFGKAIWENSPLASLMSQFQDSEGNYQVASVFESLENHTQRRRWVKSISSFIAEWAKLFVDSETQQRYMATAQILINGYLQSEGYSSKSRLDLGKPGETISSVVDEVIQKQFSTAVDSGKYIKPAISFFKETFSKSQKSGILSGLTTASLESRLISALDGELIEPVLRANRAYRYALKKKSCARYVLCAISKVEQSESEVTMKPAVAKMSSLAAAWFLSTPTKMSFWDLYSATVDTSCEKYDRKCFEFHEEDTKATTEYFHNEL